MILQRLINNKAEQKSGGAFIKVRINSELNSCGKKFCRKKRSEKTFGGFYEGVGFTGGVVEDVAKER